MENEKNRYDDIDYGWREDESTVSQQNTSRWAEFDDDPAPVNRAKQKKNKKSGGSFLKGLGIAVLALLLLFNTGTSVFLLSQHFSEEQAVAQNDTAAEMIPSDNITPATNDGTELSVAEVNQKVSPAVVLITARGMVGGGQGTGFIISDDGYIVTNAHVVADFNEITVTLNDEAKTEYPATVVGADATTDIAVLQIRAKDLPTAEIGTSADLQVGQDVVVIGNPLGEEFSGSVTTGIISALDRQVEFDDGSVYDYIQTDAAINSGNSGGPLMNMQGQVIGVNAAKIDSSVAEGMGFAIPIDDVVPVVNDLIEYGYVTERPYIGIAGESLNEQYSSFYNLPMGVHVTAITEGSPAADSKIQVDDIITHINGIAVSSVGQLNNVKNDYKPGDTVELTVYRYSTEKTFTVEVVLGEMEPEVQ
ncbi:MAG: trypsin-like peptidase domain-containing protein [Firmicutes bacterium]|nr:trypsin-like peptidase domain-containing protein [Bacillota bacterium]